MKFIGKIPKQPLTARILWDGFNYHIEIALHNFTITETIEKEAEAVGYLNGFRAAYGNMGVEIKILSGNENTETDTTPQCLSQEYLDTLLAGPDKTSNPVIGHTTVTIEEALAIAEKITGRSPVTLSVKEAAFLDVLSKIPREHISQEQADLLLAAAKKLLSA